MGELKIELGRPHGSLGLLDGRLGGKLLLRPLVQQFSGGEIVAFQNCGASDLLVGEVEAGERGRELCGALLQGDFVWTRVNYEKQVALMDNLTVGEMDFREVAADLGAQFDVVHSGELACERGPAGDVTLQRGADGDRRGWGHGGLRGG